MRRIVAIAALLSILFAASAASAQLGTDLTGGSGGVPTTRAVNTTSPLGGGGALSGDLTLTCTTCVTATAAFATDNVLIRSDGTGRGAQFTGITVDDSNLVGLGTAVPTHTLTLASTATGISLNNVADQVTNYERFRVGWNANIFEMFSEIGGSGTLREIRFGTSATQFRIGSSTGIFTLVGQASGFAQLTAGSSGAGVSLRGLLSTGAGAAVDLRNSSSLTASSGTQTTAAITGTVNQTGTAAYNALLINPTLTAVGSGGADLADVGHDGTSYFRINDAGAVDIDSTITTAGTTGNVTINKPCGTANIAAAGTAVTVTNSLVTANTIMTPYARTNDATCSVLNYVPGAGTVTINMSAACTAETSVGFCIDDMN